MPSLSELMAQRAALEAQIRELSTHERSEAIAKIRTIMAEFGLTMNDIAGRTTATNGQPKVKRTSAVAAKYRNAATGDTWSGRGLKPRWLKHALENGRTLQEFVIHPKGATPESVLAEAMKA